MNNKTYFPFSAVVGQEKLKKALILNLINPNIGGVLISGEKGSAKSTIVRSIANVMDNMSVINLPLNATEDRVVGSIDIKRAIKEGEKRVEDGLLKKAHNNFLYIDEVNLLSDHIVNILLEVSSTGINVIEREGISYSHPSKFVLVGSMNPEEGELRTQFIDRFGLYVEAKGEEDVELRIKIMDRCIKYERNPKEFCNEWIKREENFKNSIEKARNLISKVIVSEENFHFAAILSAEGKCSGNRAEIILIQTAKAIVALDGRNNIEYKDIEEAAFYALPHRIREDISFEQDHQGNEESNKYKDDKQDKDEINKDISDEQYGEDMEDSSLEGESDTRTHQSSYVNTEIMSENEDEIKESDDSTKERVEAVNEYDGNLSIKVIFEGQSQLKGSGKRSKTKTDSISGRYVKYKFPKGKLKDIAFDATLRIAACNQKNRIRKEGVISIKPEDFREKVRENRTGATILFVVDASSSMGAKRRMGIVKGLVLSLLNDAYQKRDKVGVIAFRSEEAKVLLNITRSVDLAEKCLKHLPTGGKTPLALGLYRAYELLKAEKIKNTNSLQYIILVSDGKANVSMKSQNAFEDALAIGEKIQNEGIKSMVIDTEDSYIQYGFAQKLSKVMDSQYMKINNNSESEIKSNIKTLINI
ncbi:magnesium chelatase subunit D family protein [Clostridium algidicarnis]|uniref:magnesium chelatase subunit D family protein n=1 Tax=Clostridium algidicarnis TaxID=37659 RepID=UPI0016285D18|nr:magnesium chelatase subunit D family protein [Clostridium algidicarnis]MBB6696690.1 magnesium chelatase subunit D family protein [Clostridium algidicarnis]